MRTCRTSVCSPRPTAALVFDLNDFDETLPGPFEWDVKRFAASLAVAGRDIGLSAKDRKTVGAGGRRGLPHRDARASPRRRCSRSGTPASTSRTPSSTLGPKVSAEEVPRTRKAMAKARTRDSMQVLEKLTTVVDGHRRFISNPPLIVPIEELTDRASAEEIMARMATILAPVPPHAAAPTASTSLEQFRLVGVARKVVGVGSVGTRAWVAPARGRRRAASRCSCRPRRPSASVLADYCGASKHRNEGQRVVAGQHLMQAASDIFLGWQHIDDGLDGRSRDFYVRQLRDWKYSAAIETMELSGLVQYAQLCGWTLARAHARSGDRFAIAGYLGKSDKFDRALVTYAEAYADRNEADHAALAQAVTDGRIEAVTGI